MNPGLRYLLARRLPGGLRRIRRRYSGRDGKVLLLGLALLLAGLVASQSTWAGLDPDAGIRSRRLAPEAIRAYAPAVLLLVALIGIRPGAFYFKAAEVQFLLPAPIPRPQLIVFNILSRLQIVLLSTLWVSLFVVRHAGTRAGGALAIFLLFTFNQLTAQLGGVWLAGLDPSRTARRRRWGGAAIAGALLAAILAAAWPEAARPAEIAAALIQHPVGVALSWVTRPFVELFLAATPAALLLHGGIAAAILGVELFALVRIDLSRLEGLTAHGRATGQRSKKVRLALQRDPGRQAEGVAGIRIPSRIFPRLAGAGPLAWRQLQELAREPATVLRGGLGLVAVLPVLAFRMAAPEHEAVRLAAGSLATALLMIPMMFDGADFRRDLDRMPALRSLPVSPRALVMGQLAPTAILIGIWMWIGSLLVLFIIDVFSLPIFYFVAVLIPPFAWMTAAIDNWLFLLMPYRIRTRDPGESTFVGRLTVVMTIKAIVMLVAFAISGAAAFAFWKWVAPSVILAGLVASATLFACCLPLVSGLARTFQRFDVADHPAE